MSSEFYLGHPAKEWESGLPTGNGRQGAVLFGEAGKERILLNEESLWYGGPGKRTQAAGKEKVEEIRALLERGEVQKAQKLARRYFTANPKYMTPFQPAAEAALDCFPAVSRAENYRRGISLEEGTAWIEYYADGIRYRSSLFSSARWQVSVYRMETDRKGALEFELSLNRRPFEERGTAGDGIVCLSGQCGKDGVSYCAGCMIGNTDGIIRTDGGFLSAEGASYAEIYFCVQTDYAGGDPEETCRQLLQSACRAGYEKIRSAHREDYGSMYGSMELILQGGNGAESMVPGKGERYRESGKGGETADGTQTVRSLPADELILRAEEPEVRAYLTELMFAYARYLMISSSSGCLLPANLQGIWNGSFTPPWESGYTININLQMNYWMADGAGLGGCFRPVEYLAERMLENGRRTAREVYGCRGFTAHHCTNLWGDTDVTGNWIPAFLWPAGGAWLADELYRHGLYEEDREEFRKYILPVMAESVRFFYDYLYRREDGTWVCGPSVSPENTYRLPDGQEASVTMGPTMDHQIIRELAGNCLDAFQRYGEGESVCAMAAEILEHLPPTRTGSDGRLLEWQEEYEEAEPGHRHIAHLYGLYPGREICEDAPELWEGAKKTLEYRLQNGGGHTGWSRAWIQCFYARLGEAEKLDEQLKLFFRHSVAENLWDVHPPFQIDGNFGMAAAVLEALASRRGPVIEIMRAVPACWRSGRVRGQRLPGKISLDYSWRDGRMCRLSVYSGKEQNIEIRYPGGRVELHLKPGETAAVMSQGETENG